MRYCAERQSAFCTNLPAHHPCRPLIHSFTSSLSPTELSFPHSLIYQLIKPHRALILSFTLLPAHHPSRALIHSFTSSSCPTQHSFSHSPAHQALHSTHSLIHLAMSGLEPSVANATYYRLHVRILIISFTFQTRSSSISVAGLLHVLWRRAGL